MKAKEFLESKGINTLTIKGFQTDNIDGKQTFWPVFTLMEEYAKAKCSEQRKNCANSHEEKLKEYWNVHNIKELQVEIDNIKNAKTPDFE